MCYFTQSGGFRSISLSEYGPGMPDILVCVRRATVWMKQSLIRVINCYIYVTVIVNLCVIVLISYCNNSSIISV
jgi:hypothetical protein